MKYHIYLEQQYLGYSLLDKADPPMGVVMGNIVFVDIAAPYLLLRDYCVHHGIELNEDEPALALLITQSIAALRVIDDHGVVINGACKGAGATIAGMQDEGYQIEIFGIPYPFYEQVFPHHCAAYLTQR
ncbi:hypothetical protein L9G74_04180 [Shewanella sp. C32]|uniref:Uncharacterized protein n=1 Tax=Shewanella electrica TaxID=515560 RepID=A0ABT2FH34_9GAMM|nr:hypothetical protein [Shewanella electrica]MCH1923527.1 hypothetical protein [Shewanella electrica]MCS4555624.1 hypothetical protein [Shewanella electrica]